MQVLFCRTQQAFLSKARKIKTLQVKHNIRFQQRPQSFSQKQMETQLQLKSQLWEVAYSDAPPPIVKAGASVLRKVLMFSLRLFILSVPTLA